jgi:hypothetical protein
LPIHLQFGCGGAFATAGLGGRAVGPTYCWVCRHGAIAQSVVEASISYERPLSKRSPKPVERTRLMYSCLRLRMAIKRTPSSYCPCRPVRIASASLESVWVPAGSASRRESAFRFVEITLNLFAALRRRFRHVAHVHDAERDVSRFVLRTEAIHRLLGFVVRHQFAHAEHGEHGAFAGDVQPRRHFGEVAREVDAADDACGAAESASGRRWRARVAEHVHMRDSSITCASDTARFEESVVLAIHAPNVTGKTRLP